MATKITNAVLLEHIQGIKNDLQQQIDRLDQKFTGQLTSLIQEVKTIKVNMHQGFEEAREHREALQEDLYATMQMVAKHDKKLARL